ncbi:MAG: hypothetical protein ACXVWU_02040 [Nocardioides sp.]
MASTGEALGVERRPATPTRHLSAPTPNLRRAWLLAWCATLPIALIRAGMLSEADIFWQIRTGLLTMAHRAIPSVDTFSWSVRGHEWTQNSWGFDVIAAVWYRLGGLAAVALGAAALAMVVTGLVLVLARRLGATPMVAGFAVLITSPLLMAYLVARPTLVDYIGVLALLLILSGGYSTARTTLAVAALCAVWVNLHAGASIALPIVGAYAALLLARRETRRDGLRVVPVGVGALLGVLANPYGVGLFEQTSAVRAASAEYIIEWQHMNPLAPLQVLTLALGVAAVVIAFRAGNHLCVATLTVLIVGSVEALRIQPMLVLVALPVVASALSRHPSVPGYLHSRRRVWYFGLAAAAVVAAVQVAHVGQPNPAEYPSDRVVSAVPRGCHAFNENLIGGYLILERPDVRVSMDSRNDVYGPGEIAGYLRVLNGQHVGPTLARVGCVVVPPSSGLAKRLRGDPGWQVRASDRAAVLFVRR